MLIIDFPARYCVSSDGPNKYLVSVPSVHVSHALSHIRLQAWVSNAFHDSLSGDISVIVNRAYMADQSEIIDALERICRYVMNRQETDND